MSDGAALAAAAERLVSTPFRLRGRDPAHGLDCVGLVAAALEEIGRKANVPADYGFRRVHFADFLAAARSIGFTPASGRSAPGDVLLTRPGPGQLHLLVAIHGPAFVHAHAGLGRVVRTPAPLPWPIERRWRLTSG